MQRSTTSSPAGAAPSGAWIPAGDAEVSEPPPFERIMREHNQRLFRLALGLMGDPSEAEDVLQDSYVRAFRGFPGFEGRSCLATWLATIVRNTAIDHLRARRSRQAAFALESELPLRRGKRGSALDVAQSLAPGCDPLAFLGDAELKARLESAICSLPAAFRAVFVLREIQGLSLQETAEHLDVPVATVKTRDHRARRLLRRQLGGDLDPARLRAFEFLGALCDRVVACVIARIGHDAGAGTFAQAHPSSSA